MTDLSHERVPYTGLIEEKVDSQELFKGHFLQAFRDTVRLPSSALAKREYVVHPGAVMVIPLLEGDDGQVQMVLERQFRYPIGQVMIEFPAGKLDPGEDCFHCAQRELLEETGYSATHWAHAGVLHPVIAYSTEFIDIWFARGLSAGSQKLDEGEFLDVFTANMTQLLQWCAQGQVTDGKTLTGALWLQNVLSGAWSLEWQEVSIA
ncbi:NUDIX hydrolase [Rhodoferax sp.]|uniref:NUDIX domain-containing protein n=1 Tax=Rhodoferax sp. TaxID=50421 RepID=UPI00260EE56B|nr:NUDIX hydrolase [Rhodoferax sp.]MDD2661932.1 NUDIX hydrolase [Methylococcales bacterium]MDD4943421.1 NUDIX hydrolase [Rhodoferax sp.]MDD5479531.1 NUDIX hydrolase [Rhodoferax sp.]